MRAGILVLAALIFILGCKKSADRQTHTGKDNLNLSVNKDNRATDGNKESKNAGEPKDYTREFNALCVWCEESVNEIGKIKKANPIRGNELANSKLEYLRREIEGKTVYWRVKVRGIDPAGSVLVESFHRTQHEMINNGHRIKYYDFKLSVPLQEQHSFSGEDLADDPIYRINQVPTSKLRELNIGEFVQMTGTVAKVDYHNSFTIKLDGVKLD